MKNVWILVGYHLGWLRSGYGESAFYAFKWTHVTKLFHDPPLQLPKIVLRSAIDSQLPNPSVRLFWWVLGVFCTVFGSTPSSLGCFSQLFRSKWSYYQLFRGSRCKNFELDLPLYWRSPPFWLSSFVRSFYYLHLVCALYMSFYPPLYFLMIFLFHALFLPLDGWDPLFAGSGGATCRELSPLLPLQWILSRWNEKIFILKIMWNTCNIESHVAKLAWHSWPWSFNKKIFFCLLPETMDIFFSPFLRLFEEILLFHLTWSRLRIFPVPSPLCFTYRGHLKICFPYGNRAFFQPHV